MQSNKKKKYNFDEHEKIKKKKELELMKENKFYGSNKFYKICCILET